MAPSETTTLRVPTELRDEIAKIADEQGTTMLEVVTTAVHQLQQEHWWTTVHHALDDMTDEDSTAYQAEVEGLDGAAAEGLRDD